MKKAAYSGCCEPTPKDLYERKYATMQEHTHESFIFPSQAERSAASVVEDPLTDVLR